MGLTSWIVLLIPVGALVIFQSNYKEFLPAIVLAVCEIIALVLILLIKRKSDDEEEDEKMKKATVNIVLLIILLLVPIFLGIYFNTSNDVMVTIISTVIWQFIFSGFGEEIRYRGYYQSRMNEEFGRPYKFLGVEFGSGLVIRSIIYIYL